MKYDLSLFIVLLSFIIYGDLLSQRSQFFSNISGYPVEFEDPFDILLPTSLKPECSSLLLSELIPNNGPQIGFKGGMNFGQIPDLQKAQLVSLPNSNQTYYVSEIRVLFSEAKVGVNGTVSAKLFYSRDSEVKPNNAPIAESKSLRVSQIQSDVELVRESVFKFDEAIELQENTFFLSIDFSDLYNSGDTLAIFYTSDNGNCSLAEGAWAWRRIPTGQNQSSLEWQNLGEIYELGGDLAIHAVISNDPNCRCKLTEGEDINIEVTDATCELSNGEIEVSLEDPLEVYTIVLNQNITVRNGGTPQIFPGLGVQPYSLTVSNSAFCCLSENIEISSTPAINGMDVDVVGVSCSESSDGQISASASGGTGTYEYTLSSNDGEIRNSSGNFFGLRLRVI